MYDTKQQGKTRTPRYSGLSFSTELKSLVDILGFQPHKSNSQPKSLLPEAMSLSSKELQGLSDILKPSDLDWSQVSKVAAPMTIALTLAVAMPPLFGEAQAQVNTVNNGRDVAGGTYYNTAGSKTTFQNSSGGGLWVHSGTTVRGLESNGSGTPTGNGGHLHFNAPGSVVRIDGTIDVNAIKSGNYYQGNGGKVTVDSAYLYQTGNIYANGVNGGDVRFNVESATFGPNAKVNAMGYNGGMGGIIKLNATGSVDIKTGAVFDASGKVVANVDTNVITIEGGLVNNKGIVRARGITSGQEGTNGGEIELVAWGNTETGKSRTAVEVVNDTLHNHEATPMFTANETSVILNRLDFLAANYDGDIINTGTLDASGGQGSCDGGGGEGGHVCLFALGQNSDIQNYGVINVSGGNGDTSDANYGFNGGNAGAVTLYSTNTILNNGAIRAFGGNGGNGVHGGAGGNGGNGGVVYFNAASNPTGTGVVSVNGGSGGNGSGNAPGGNGGNGGTIYVPNPQTLAINYNLQGGNGGNAGNSCDPPGQKGQDGQLLASSTTNPPCPVPQPPSDPPPPPPNDPPPPPPNNPPQVPPPPTSDHPPTDNPPPVVYNDPVIIFEKAPTPSPILAPPNLFLAQEAPVPPETELRKRLENEIAEAQNLPAMEQPKQPPRIQRGAKVRGYW